MIKKLNLPLIILPTLVFVFGFITLLSSSPSLVRFHVLNFLIGVVFYVIFTKIDYTVYKHMWKHLFVISVILLFITNLFAEFRSGAGRWLEIGPVSFQTSELCKLALIIFLSSYIVENKEKLNYLRTILVVMFSTILCALLVFIQPDLGTAAVLVILAGGILFYAGFSKLYMLIGILVMGIFSAPLWHLLKDYQKSRILVFLNPQLDILGSGYNVMQSIIAIGSGGLTGKGFGQGTQANLQFLPAYWTDFIFASFAEEWGFIGVFLFVSIYILLLTVILVVSSRTNDVFAKLLCVGVFMVFFSQFTINVGMNLGVMPVTGVTLPLVSYGGSSMLFSMIMLGIVQNVWQKCESIN